MICVAVAAVGLFVFRVTWGRADEFIVLQYSEDWRPWNRGHAFRIRLDIDRLRANNLSKEDVMEALRPSTMIDPKQVDPPPGVVFMTRYVRPDRYENIILKADADGEIVRLKDVAKVEVRR
jgi:multidrug efflux pump subunit AcrB